MSKKATREAGQFNKITDRLTQKASDGRIGGRETARLTARFGSGAVSNALAKIGLGNPNLKIGKGVTQTTGLKFFGEGDGRYATYNPSKITRGQMQFLPGMFPNSDYTLGAQNFGIPNWNTMGKSIYGNQWYDTGSGRYRYGGPAGAALPTGKEPDVLPPPETPTPQIVPDEEMPDELPLDDMNKSMITGQYGGSGLNFGSNAMGWKSKQGLRGKAGRKAQGYNSMTIAAAKNAPGVGVNA